MNLIAISLLALLRPPLAKVAFSESAPSVRSIGWIGPVRLLILGIGAAGAFARNYFRPVVIESPRELDLGVLDAGTKKEVAISLRNVSSKPVTIVGAKTSCTCSLIRGLPIEIGPGSSVEIILSVVPPSRSEFEGTVICYSNNTFASSIRCRYFAHINIPQENLKK